MNHNIEWKAAHVDLSTNITTVESVACLVKGAIVITGISGQDCPIKDGSTTRFAIKASAITGDAYGAGPVRFETSLIVDPDDAATGEITILYRILNEINS